MKSTITDYIQPPSYTESQRKIDTTLTDKLKARINQDLIQINGVYDSQITEAEQNKIKNIEVIENNHKKLIESINEQRKLDISRYHKKAEKHIDNLISSMGNSPQKITYSWWQQLFNLNNL